MSKLILFLTMMMTTTIANAATAPALPKVYVDTTMPTTSITKRVCDSGCDYTNDQLQRALDEATLGTTILLQPGVTYTPLDDRGFLLTNKSGSGWIIIRPDLPSSSLPPEGTRINPSYSPVLPKLVRSPVGNYAISCLASAHHYRVIGVEIMNPGNADTPRLIGSFVNCDGRETVLADQTHHILFDRVYIHGPSAPGSVGVNKGVVLGGQYQGVIDSHIEDLTFGSDANAVVGWGGAGPWIIRNNYLSASGENILIGGATPIINGVTPSDIEIRHNYLYKPLKWRDDPAYNSGTYKITTKNLLELKNAARVLIDGNVFENSWPDGQYGHAVLFTPRGGGSTGSDPWTTVVDITLTNNMFRNCANGLALSGGGPTISLDQGGPTARGGRFLIQNNIFIGLGGDYNSNYMSGNFAMIGMGPSDLQIRHNTVVAYAGSTIRGTTFAFSYGVSDEKALFPLMNFVLQDKLLH